MYDSPPLAGRISASDSIGKPSRRKASARDDGKERSMKKAILLVFSLGIFGFGCSQSQETKNAQSEASKTVPAVTVPVAKNEPISFPTHVFDGTKHAAGKTFPLRFTYPEEWDAEYFPSLQAINLFTRHVTSSTREPSLVLIRVHAANESTAIPRGRNVITSEQLTVGKEKYSAKKHTLEAFDGKETSSGEPTWLSQVHLLTEIRPKEPRKPFYSVAIHPDVDRNIVNVMFSSWEMLK